MLVGKICCIALLALAADPLFMSAAAGWQDEVKQDAPISTPLVEKLIGQLNAPKYRDRQRAQQALIDLGPRLIEILDGLELPDVVEIQVRLNRIRAYIGQRGITANTWTLVCRPLEGQSLNLKQSREIRFFDDGTFKQIGTSSSSERTWSMDEDSDAIVLSFNRGYATYRGQFVDDTRIIGTAENIKGKKWRFTLKRLDH